MINYIGLVLQVKEKSPKSTENRSLQTNRGACSNNSNNEGLRPSAYLNAN